MSTSMDQGLKAKWVAALRSGEYKQAHKQLKKNSGYCCLGVLCEVAGLRISPSGLSVDINGLSHDYAPIYALGIPDEVGLQLIKMNDGYSDGGPDDYVPPHEFSVIADYIEATL